MVNEVNKLIFNTLVEYQGVYIPNLGTLSIGRIPSRKRRGRVVSPLYTINFNTECKAVSLATIVSSMANVDRAAADDIISRWQNKATTDGRVIIEGVGIIANGCYTPDKELLSLLNAHNETIILSRSKRAKRWPLWLGLCLSFVALGTSGYLLICRPTADEPTTTLETSTATLANNNDIADIKQDSINISSAVSDTTVAHNAEPATPKSDVTSTEQNAVESAVEEVKSEDKIESDSTEEAITDWRQIPVRHYVIFGSYSTMANANAAVRKIVRRNPSAQCKIIPLGRMYAVAVYGSFSRKECEMFKRLNRSYYKDAWIHSPKNIK